MSYKLYLDDDRIPKTEGPWVIVRSYEEFIKVIEEKGTPELISFDHDIGDPDETINGAKCAQYIIDTRRIVKQYNIHSANSVGRDNIEGKMNGWWRFNGYKPVYSYTTYMWTAE